MRLFVLALVAVLVPGISAEAQQPDHLDKTLVEWRADLESPARIERLLAVRAIGEMAVANRQRAARELFEALGHSDSAVRYWAAVAAVHLSEPYVPGGAMLRRVLHDEVPEVRIQAALALLGSDSEQEALRTLETLLSHPNRGVRLHAAHAADAIGDQAAGLRESLDKALDDDFDYVQRVARHALWRLGMRPCPYRACK